LSLCTTAHPVYTGIANICGTSISETTMRPDHRRGSRGSRPSWRRRWSRARSSASRCPVQGSECCVYLGQSGVTRAHVSRHRRSRGTGRARSSRSSRRTATATSTPSPAAASPATLALDVKVIKCPYPLNVLKDTY
jgi:hypothetical protein